MVGVRDDESPDAEALVCCLGKLCSAGCGLGPRWTDYLSWALSRSSISTCSHPSAINLVLFQILGLGTAANAATGAQSSQSLSFLNGIWAGDFFWPGKKVSSSGAWKKRPRETCLTRALCYIGCLANSIDGEVDAAGNGTELLVS